MRATVFIDPDIDIRDDVLDQDVRDQLGRMGLVISGLTIKRRPRLVGHAPVLVLGHDLTSAAPVA